MTTVSTLTGEVIDGIPVLYKTINNEKFYTIRVKFRSCDINVMISEHIMQEEYTGVIKVTGYLASFRVKDGSSKYDYVFVGTQIEQAEVDSVYTNLVNFCYKVTHVGNLCVNDFGVEVLTIYPPSLPACVSRGISPEARMRRICRCDASMTYLYSCR